MLKVYVFSKVNAFAPYAHVASYRARCFARPAWKQTIDR